MVFEKCNKSNKIVILVNGKFFNDEITFMENEVSYLEQIGNGIKRGKNKNGIHLASCISKAQ